MNQVGFRIIYDQDGAIIGLENEAKGSHVTDRKVITSLHHIDLEFGAIDFTKYELKGIDPLTQKPILEELPVVETEEQKHIRELEDEILLAAENSNGGIL